MRKKKKYKKQREREKKTNANNWLKNDTIKEIAVPFCQDLLMKDHTMLSRFDKQNKKQVPSLTNGRMVSDCFFFPFFYHIHASCRLVALTSSIVTDKLLQNKMFLQRCFILS